jgi:hypothetical protein
MAAFAQIIYDPFIGNSHSSKKHQNMALGAKAVA